MLARQYMYALRFRPGSHVYVNSLTLLWVYARDLKLMHQLKTCNRAINSLIKL